MRPPLKVRRLPLRLTCDARRTITRFFWPGAERAQRILLRVAGLDGREAEVLFGFVAERFLARDPGLEHILLENFEEVARRTDVPSKLTPRHRLLVGAYFTMEYAFESAALFNPSMVPAIEQEGVPPGATRFLMSLRAVGEGHVSSVVFRRGVITAEGQILIEPVGLYCRAVRKVQPGWFNKDEFLRGLIEIGAYDPAADWILDRLSETFRHDQLLETLRAFRRDPEGAGHERVADSMRWLAESNYQIDPGHATGPSDAVIFPLSETESQGMEDMRLVRFTPEDGTAVYYGTYTAFNGRQILPQIMEYRTNGDIEIRTLHGRYARNKGLALFPRPLNGQYAMIGRIDGENLYLLSSRNLHFWNDAVRVQEPKHAWEFVQIGNCGSPIETEAGWLLLTHGVGPMRRYCIGAMLLDRDDPSKVVGRLAEPLLEPTEEERTGYVPNVVYSCGGMVHHGQLVIPYGISDAATGFAMVGLDDLLTHLCG